MTKKLLVRAVIGLLSVTGLVVVFVFQRTDVAAFFELAQNQTDTFLVNRTVRFFLNDLFAIGVIYALYVEKKYLMFALWVQVTGFFLFLIPYFFIRASYPSYDGPLISYLHRLILHPTLLLLLVPAFYYQKRLERLSIDSKMH
jgi:exosortase F-associated protein